jgi:putative peptidoglycan lipid II flippase
MVGLRKRLSGLDGRRVLSTHLRAIAAVLPAAGLGWLLLRVIPDSSGMSRAADVATSAGWCVVIGTAMALVYGIGLVVLRVDEWRSLIRGPLKRLGFRVP